MAQPVRGIVTPEAVLLEFQTASVPTRVLQFSLDVLIQVTALFLVFLVLGVAASGPSIPTWVAIVFVTVALFAVVLGYPIAMETLWSGRTVGMAAAGLRVVTNEGAPIRFRHAAVRGALGLIDFWLIPVGVIATVTVLVTRNNQRLGDLAAGTLVLRERTARDFTAQAVTFYPPPGFEQYASSLDVGVLTPDQYGVIRSFLLRVTELNQAARVHLALTMANSVALTMGHEPPPGVGPEAFLACVAAAYQWREGGGTFRPPPPPTALAPPPPPPAGVAAPAPSSPGPGGFVPPT